MIEKLWTDLLRSIDSSDEPIREISFIVNNLLITHRIDYRTFICNYAKLRRHRHPLLIEPWFGEADQAAFVTPSIDELTKPGAIAPAFPIWFCAAYPDVMLWFYRKQREFLELTNQDLDEAAIKQMKLIGIENPDIIADESEIVNGNQKWRPQFLLNLVENYIKMQGGKLETQGSDSFDIYEAQKLRAKMGLEEDNYIAITQIITRYYMELKEHYQRSFKNEKQILFATGILDTQYYIFEDHSIDPQEILQLANEAVTTPKPLLNFVINLGILISKIESPFIENEIIEDAWESQSKRLEKLIMKLKRNYSSDVVARATVDSWMNTPEFLQILESTEEGSS